MISRATSAARVGLALGKGKGDLRAQLRLHALENERGVVARGKAHELGVAEVGGEHQLADLLDEQDNRLTVRQAPVCCRTGGRDSGFMRSAMAAAAS